MANPKEFSTLYDQIATLPSNIKDTAAGVADSLYYGVYGAERPQQYDIVLGDVELDEHGYYEEEVTSELSEDNISDTADEQELSNPAAVKVAEHVTTLTKPFSEILAEVNAMQKAAKQAKAAKESGLADTAGYYEEEVKSTTDKLVEKIGDFGAKAGQVVEKVNEHKSNFQNAAKTATEVAGNVATFVNTAMPYVNTAMKVGGGVVEVGSAVVGGLVTGGPVSGATAGISSMVSVLAKNYSAMFNTAAKSATPPTKGPIVPPYPANAMATAAVAVPNRLAIEPPPPSYEDFAPPPYSVR